MARRKVILGAVSTALYTSSTAILLGVLALGCGADDGGSEDKASTITVLYESDDYVLGPSRDDSPKYLMFLPLVRGYASQAEPLLAERWEHSPDYKTWTFHLRHDVRWHDGVPVTAHDVAFCLELFAHPDVLWSGHGGGAENLGVEEVSVPDDHTIVITWKEPKGPDHVLDGWTVYYPKHLLQGLDPKQFFSWDFWTHPIGNGPYRYVRRVPQTMIELEANPDYFAGKPAIERVILKLSTANKVIELTSGNVDAAYYIPPADVFKLSADPRFRIYHLFASTEPQAIHWNHGHPFLADPRVRRALSHAIDRRELLRVNNLPDETPLVGGLSPWDRTDRLYREGKLNTGFPYDRDTAKALLEEAGWADENGDGVRQRGGVAARFTMMTPQGGLSAVESGLLIQDQLRRVGVKMEIRPVERIVWREAYRSGDFDATIWDVPNTPQRLLESEFFGDGSRIGYRNPEIVRWLEMLTVEMDPDAQDTLYARINEILRRDVPFTFLFPYVEASVAHRRIRGLRTPDRVNLLKYIAELWIEDEN